MSVGRLDTVPHLSPKQSEVGCGELPTNGLKGLKINIYSIRNVKYAPLIE